MSTKLTPENLHETFVTAGFDTTEKVLGLLSMAGAQMTRNALLIKLDGLRAKAAEQAQTLNTEREAIQAEINSLTDQIAAAASAPAN